MWEFPHSHIYIPIFACENLKSNCRNMSHKFVALFLLLLLIYGCRHVRRDPPAPMPEGALFIVGGGARPPELMARLVKEAALSGDEYVVVLPMSSEEPDTAFFYVKEQFIAAGIDPERVVNMKIATGDQVTAAYTDSVRHAGLIWITGGDQSRFMEVALGSPLYDAIRDAYMTGATVAGTSAGAAVMSRLMITGNEKRYPEYTGNYRTIEADNIEVAEGLGLLRNVVIDQHFVYRMRMNRLMAVVLEHPGITGVGIDESTAILVRGDSAEVVGLSQVIILRNNKLHVHHREKLLGGERLSLDVMLPGERFLIGR
jgi:cyanophycinase